MTKRNQPITSILAHDSVKDDKEVLHAKIIAGMNKLRVGGNVDEISVYAGLKREEIWRRMSELERDGKIFNTGLTHTSITGRAAIVWQLCDLSGIGDEPIKPTLKPPSTPPKTTQHQRIVQTDLFTPNNI